MSLKDVNKSQFEVELESIWSQNDKKSQYDNAFSSCHEEAVSTTIDSTTA